MISILHSNPKSNDITKIREAILRMEKEVLELSKRPNFYEKEIKNRKLVLNSYRRLVRIHEAKGGQAIA
ncbi:MAG TPA: hypothetical protein PKY82_34690 [Pyrinomonadaceae bacterium]|nr:hypothetical protein [Pyrinomonadaceae bacterium]